MKIVVDIPEEHVKTLKKLNGLGYYHEVIANGQPLSEVLDEISAEIEGMITGCERGREIMGDDFGIYAFSIQAYSNVLKIVEEHKANS